MVAGSFRYDQMHPNTYFPFSAWYTQHPKARPAIYALINFSVRHQSLAWFFEISYASCRLNAGDLGKLKAEIIDML